MSQGISYVWETFGYIDTDPEIKQGGGWHRFEVGSFIYCA